MDGNQDTTGAEFPRQLRSGQLRRFIGTLPSYAVQPELPDRFLELLHQLDRVAENAGCARRERITLRRE